MCNNLLGCYRLWEKSKESYLILCGGVVSPNKSITEAVNMQKACLDIGISPDHIIIENKSTITRENIVYAAPLVNSLGIANPKIVVISSPTHMRRVDMNLQRFHDMYPNGTEFFPVASTVQGFNRSNWYSNEVMQKETATELRFIHEYLYELDYAQFDF